MISGSVAANNGTGILSLGSKATLWIGQSAVSGNGKDWQPLMSGVVQSYLTNQINGNGTTSGQIPTFTGGSD
jgi:hypothetical protein